MCGSDNSFIDTRTVDAHAAAAEKLGGAAVHLDTLRGVGDPFVESGK